MTDQEGKVIQEVPEGLDCYGYLYDPFYQLCRSQCAFRFSCQEEVKKRLKAEGEEEFKNKQRRIVMENNNVESAKKEKPVSNTEGENFINPEVSEIISEAIEICKNRELKPVYRKGYLAFKIKNRNILALTRLKAKSLKGVIKFIYSKNPEDFPEVIRNRLMKDRIGGFCCPDISTPKELEELLDVYLQEFKPK